MKHRDSPLPPHIPPTRGPGPTEARVEPPSTINSAALLAGAREVLIRHGDEAYRLRLTASNKLILTNQTGAASSPGIAASQAPPPTTDETRYGKTTHGNPGRHHRPPHRDT
eukprot:gene4222-5281_t